MDMDRADGLTERTERIPDTVDEPCCFLLRLASLLKSGSGATDLTPVRKGWVITENKPPHRRCGAFFYSLCLEFPN